jgi:hypothetical protein
MDLRNQRLARGKTAAPIDRHPAIPPVQPYHLLLARGMIVFLAKQVKTNSVLEQFTIPIR